MLIGISGMPEASFNHDRYFTSALDSHFRRPTAWWAGSP